MPEELKVVPIKIADGKWNGQDMPTKGVVVIGADARSHVLFICYDGFIGGVVARIPGSSVYTQIHGYTTYLVKVAKNSASIAGLFKKERYQVKFL